MVHAVIHSLAHSDNKQQLVLLEFQGSFYAHDQVVKDIKIGDIEFNNDRATVIIGHHRIEGIKKKLPKPVAIIHKRHKQQNTMEIDQIDDGKLPITEYDVTTIIREKYVFSNRPRLVVKENLRGLTRIGG
ncbi:Ctf8-domain-containing protein [Cunninghamella echinulata]|nr:Ctf8-domain-containing protein [Cunninghamella echinulata]